MREKDNEGKGRIKGLEKEEKGERESKVRGCGGER